MADEQSTGQPNVGGFSLNHPTIISLLYLGAFITGISGLIGIILAYVWKSEDEGTWAESHNTYLRRTFWIGLLYSVIATILTMLLIGFLLYFVIAVWMIIRSIKSILASQKSEPMPDPNTWLI